jgi:hypothetical protein
LLQSICNAIHFADCKIVKGFCHKIMLLKSYVLRPPVLYPSKIGPLRKHYIVLEQQGTPDAQKIDPKPDTLLANVLCDSSFLLYVQMQLHWYHSAGSIPGQCVSGNWKQALSQSPSLPIVGSLQRKLPSIAKLNASCPAK